MVEAWLEPEQLNSRAWSLEPFRKLQRIPIAASLFDGIQWEKDWAYFMKLCGQHVCKVRE